MADEQDVFRHGFQFIQLLNQCLRVATGCQFVRKSEAFFPPPRSGNDFGGLARAQKRAGKNQVEIQVQVLQGGGNLPELTFAFGCEGSFGIRLEPRRAAFHCNAVPQDIQIHRGSIPLRATGAILPNVTFFHLGWDEVAS